MVNLFDLGANLQAAGDMARFRHTQVSNVLALESPLYARVGGALKAMGHHVESVDGAGMGGYQAILVMPDSATGTRVYRAGSDFRKDGEAVGW
jgi:gamma-glutamyltranspeptidase/glutathione hydrolase